MGSAIGQFRCDDLTRTDINSEVQLPPSPILRRFAQMPDMNPKPRAVDEQMDRSICCEPAKPNIASYSAQFRTRY